VRRRLLLVRREGWGGGVVSNEARERGVVLHCGRVVAYAQAGALAPPKKFAGVVLAFSAFFFTLCMLNIEATPDICARV